MSLVMLLLILASSLAHAHMPGRAQPRYGAAAAVLDAWRVPRRECDAGPCALLPHGESEDCILRCLAPDCYEAVYGAAPLEPGEIDAARQTLYNSCLRRHEKELRARGEWPPGRRDRA